MDCSATAAPSASTTCSASDRSPAGRRSSPECKKMLYCAVEFVGRRQAERAMPEQHHTKVLIIGAGPAGFTAAIYAARANLHPILATGIQPGGQLMITTDVENYPGFADIIQGPWLMEQMQRQAEHVGTRIILDQIVSLDLGRRPFLAIGDSGHRYVGDTVILATC